MNAGKYNFSLKYVPNKKEWAIYDDGVFHSDGYKSRKDAQEQIDAILGTDRVSRKDLLHFTKDWRTRVGTSNN